VRGETVDPTQQAARPVADPTQPPADEAPPAHTPPQHQPPA